MNEDRKLRIEVAEKSVVGNIVPPIIGLVAGSCTTTLVMDILDNLAPEPVTIGKKITYGIGAFVIGGYVGTKVEEVVELDMKEMVGGFIQLKRDNAATSENV